MTTKMMVMLSQREKQGSLLFGSTSSLLKTIFRKQSVCAVCEEISRGKSPSLFSMSPLIRHLRKCSEQEHSIVASRGRKKPPSTSATKQSGPTKSKTKSALKITASNVWKHFEDVRMDKTMAMCIYCYVVIVKKGLSDKAMGQSLKEHIKERTEFSPSYKSAGTSTDQQASPARLDLQLLVSFTVYMLCLPTGAFHCMLQWCMYAGVV